MQDFKIAFVQAAYGYMPVRSHADQMMFYGINCARGLLKGSYAALVNYAVDQARNGLVEAFINSDTTHLLWVDCDMRLPWGNTAEDPDALVHLIVANKDVVGATYFGHDDKATLVAWDSLEPPSRMADFDPNRLQKVAGIGMGCALVRMDVYRQMTAKYRDKLWYKCDVDKEGRYLGEDYWFARRCQELGIDIWMDGRIRCGHRGEDEATYEKWKRTNSKHQV